MDGTTGQGGHSLHILGHTPANTRLICIDRDESALDAAQKRLDEHRDRVAFIHGSYADLGSILARCSIPSVSGILLDLGFSSFQIDDPRRGMSFHSKEPLDMRYDREQETDARTLVNTLSKEELKKLFRTWGEEHRASSIAGAIVRRRGRSPIETASELAEVVESAVPPKERYGRIHPATRVFQALRIAVNGELDHVTRFLEGFSEWLQPGGRAVVISYHSLEDRAVKNAFRFLASPCRCPRDLPRCVCGAQPVVRVLTPRPIAPGIEETERNPRSRSARLRAVERI